MVAVVIIKALRVSNYRCIMGETLHCDRLTVLVGPNGSGKSSFLRALDLFYAPASNCTAQDFYGYSTDRDIEIEITFTDLTNEERNLFSSYMDGDDLTVVRVFVGGGGRDSGKYYGSRLQNTDFAEVRRHSGRELLNRYREFRDGDLYRDDLPPVRSQADANAEMERWERDHPDALQRMRDDGQFFGFTNVGRGYLGNITRFLFIPAVRDAGDEAEEGRNTSITQLMDLVVRTTLAQRRDLADFREQVESRYKELTDPANTPELGQLAADLSQTLQTFYQNASLVLNWLPASDIELPPPKAEIGLVEDNFQVSVARSGHGLQRAFILALLQHLAVAEATVSRVPAQAIEDGEEAVEAEPVEPPGLNLIIGIEEPELYQHPSRQRHFARVLYELAHGNIPGVAARTQVLYATHSPLLIGIEQFHQVRRMRRIPGEEGSPRVTSVVGTTWGAIAETIWRADGEPGIKYTGESLKPRVSTLMTPWMNEGFFADVVVLVEGEDDRAAVLGVAQARDLDLESEGIPVIPCGGKASLDRPAAIFRGLDIPTYLIWDSDHGKFSNENEQQSAIKENQRLLRLVGAPVVDWPEAIEEHYACFKTKLEATIETEIGADIFNAVLGQQQEHFAIPNKSQALKKPLVIANILKAARERGKISASLEDIVEKILALKAAN